MDMQSRRSKHRHSAKFAFSGLIFLFIRVPMNTFRTLLLDQFRSFYDLALRVFHVETLCSLMQKSAIRDLLIDMEGCYVS